MRIKVTKSKNKVHYSIIKDYTTSDGKRTTKVFENLGNQEQIEERFGFQNTLDKIKEYISSLDEKPLPLYKDPNKKIEKNVRRKFNVGYLFLKSIYYSLNLDKMCNEIKDKYQFKFNLNSILECLIYSRILWPSSKLSTYEQSDTF